MPAKVDNPRAPVPDAEHIPLRPNETLTLVCTSSIGTTPFVLPAAQRGQVMANLGARQRRDANVVVEKDDNGASSLTVFVDLGA